MKITAPSYSVGDHVILHARSQGGLRRILPCKVVKVEDFGHTKIMTHTGEEMTISAYSTNVTKVTEEEYNQAIMENM